MELTHLNSEGRAIMVDVTAKDDTRREAVAEGLIHFNEAVAAALEEGKSPKGDVIAVATTAGIMAVKRTWELIPMCHNIPVGSCLINFEREDRSLRCRCTVRTTGKTGAEMEALTGVSVALLTVYDMCKAVDRTMEIDGVRLRRKTGGKSGTVINE